MKDDVQRKLIDDMWSNLSEDEIEKSFCGDEESLDWEEENQRHMDKIRKRKEKGQKISKEEADELKAYDKKWREFNNNISLAFDSIYGKSLCELRKVVPKLAHEGMKLLFIGERGTGKELLAGIYATTINRKRFSVNCAGVNKDLAASKLFGHVKGAFTGANEPRPGLFVTAKDGVVFLDELGSSDDDFQVQLLRVLETGDFQPLGSDETQKKNNVLICAATSEFEPDKLRPELRDRFVTLYVPPLRAHPKDIPEILFHLFKYGINISSKVLEALKKHPWPGNVRELQKTLQLAQVLAKMDRKDTIRLQHLPTLDTSTRTDKSPRVCLYKEIGSKPLPREYFFRPPKQCTDQEFPLSFKTYRKEFLDHYKALGYTATDLHKKYPDTSVATFQSALKTKK